MEMLRRNHHTSFASALALTTMLTSVAWSFAPAMAAEGSVEEVIVTAQRRAERLENVPMAVTVVSPETMSKAGAVTLQELGQVAPSVLVSNTGVNTQPSIRGVTALPNGANAENNVAVYIDGLYQPDPYSLNSDFANLADVQVLKGPQGTLYGRNATGGAILINTLAPSKTWTGNLEASYAEYNERTFSGYLSGPINDRVRFGIAAYSRHSDGYYKLSDPTTGAKSDRNAAPIKKDYVRLKFEADLADNLTATLGYNYVGFSDGTVLQYTPFQYIAPTLPAPPVRSPTPLDTKSENILPHNNAFNHDATFKLVWQTGIGTLTSTSGYTFMREKNLFDLDGTYAALSGLDSSFRRETTQTNLNYNITAIKNLDLVVGGTYYDSKLRSDHNNGIGAGGVFTSITYSALHPTSYSFYVDGTYHLTDKISLGLGGAYAHEKVVIDYSTRTPAQLAAGTYGVAPVSASAPFKKFTPRASLRYEFAPLTSAYFSYSQGFKAGTWQVGVVPNAPVKQETIDAYELGFKMSRSSVRLEAAAFYYDYSNIQTSVAVPRPGCTTPPFCQLTVLLFNGPRSHIYGLDGQVSVTPTEQLTVRLGAAWVHARYLAFTNATGTGLNPTTNVNVSSQVQDWSNQQMPRAPSMSGNLGIDYTVPISQGSILFSANASFTSSYVVSDPSLYGPLAGVLATRQRYRQEGYALLSSTITWTDPSGKYSLSLFGRNLTDKRYFMNYRGSGGGDIGIYAPPRVIGGRAKVNF